MNPKVSVIVAVYNAEKTLRRCLDSLINQELTDIEIIILDDGSSDRSGAICDEYAAKDARIKVIHKDNEGVSATKQQGLDMAAGEYFIYLDSDDYVDKTAYRKMYDKALEEGSDIVCCDTNRLVKDGIKREGYLINSFGHVDFLNGLIDILPGFMSNRMIRRSLVDKYQVRFPEGMSFGEDKTFLVELLSKSLNAGERLIISHVPEALWYYDTVANPNSLMKLAAKQKLDARLHLWEVMGKNLDLKLLGKTYYKLLVKHGFAAFWNGTITRKEFETLFSKHQEGIRSHAPKTSYTWLVLQACSGKWDLAQRMKWLAYGRILSEKVQLALFSPREKRI